MTGVMLVDGRCAASVHGLSAVVDDGALVQLGCGCMLNAVSQPQQTLLMHSGMFMGPTSISRPLLCLMALIALQYMQTCPDLFRYALFHATGCRRPVNWLEASSHGLVLAVSLAPSTHAAPTADSACRSSLFAKQPAGGRLPLSPSGALERVKLVASLQ
jgi:hypothetical protein